MTHKIARPLGKLTRNDILKRELIITTRELCICESVIGRIAKAVGITNATNLHDYRTDADLVPLDIIARHVEKHFAKHPANLFPPVAPAKPTIITPA